jgi:three-Cys-motif partner protein
LEPAVVAKLWPRLSRLKWVASDVYVMRTSLLVSAAADGLKTTAIRRWALDKYRLVSLYSRLFSTGMKNKWAVRAYIDLCAGSGFSEMEESGQLYYGSPLLALDVPDPFNTYVFCERDDDSLQALRQRTRRLFQGADVRFVPGDYDEQIGEVAEQIPKGRGVLSLCFADPFDLSIKFSSIRHLAAHRIDFLFVLALYMDANRNESHYTSTDNPKIDEFLEIRDWRQRWQDAKAKRMDFPHFLGEQFSKQMESIGYLPFPFHQMRLIRSDTNLPLYHLALFSKHERAYDYWDDVLKYGTDQISFENW